MDFKRIGWIFLIAFSFLNVFLFSIYKEADDEDNVVYRTDQQIPIEDRLKSENIKYAKKFSNKHLQGYYLSGKPTNMDLALTQERKKMGSNSFLNTNLSSNGQKLTHVIDGEKLITDKEKAQEMLNNYLKQDEQFLLGKEYTYLADGSSFTKEYPTLIAAQSYEGISIDDSSSRLEISLQKRSNGYRLTSYNQTHISDLIPLREAMKLYSEAEIMNTLYVNNKIPNKSTIEWTHLAYTLTLKVRGQNVYVPAWFVRIKMEDGSTQIERVNALTNRIITNSPVQKVENS